MYDLAVHVFDNNECLKLKIEYCTALFTEVTVSYIVRHFKKVLSDISFALDMPIHHFDVLDNNEKELLRQFQSGADFPFHPRPIHVLLKNKRNCIPWPMPLWIEVEHGPIKRLMKGQTRCRSSW